MLHLNFGVICSLHFGSDDFVGILNGLFSEKETSGEWVVEDYPPNFLQRNESDQFECPPTGSYVHS
jgi:hypothetical protein